MNTIPEHQSIIPYGIDTVKAAIDKFAEVNNGSDYTLMKKNDVFGTYEFFINRANSWNGFSLGNMTVTLTKVDDTNTRFIVQTLNTGQAQQTNISEMKVVQTNFLSAISKILQGEYNISEIQVAKGTGCLGMALVIVSLGLALSLSFITLFR